MELFRCKQDGHSSHLSEISTERKQRAEWKKQSGSKTYRCGTKLTAYDAKL